MPTPALVDAFAEGVTEALEEVGIDARVEYEPLAGTKLYRLYVVSDDFRSLQHAERQDLVWRIADEVLTPAQTRRISMILTLTGDELGYEDD